MSKNEGEIVQPDIKTGFDDLLEDLFGLNIRSFQSLKALFLKPADYFNAAKTKDWSNQSYTPSPRLWIGLIAITVATRFIWGGADGAFIQTVSEQAKAGFQAGANEEVGAALSHINWPEAVEKMFGISLLAQPFVMVAIMMLLATMVRFWGERLTYVVRLRYLFAIIIPASAVNLATTIFIFVVPMSFMFAISIAQIILMFVLYIATALMGPFKGEARDSAIPKSIVLAIVLFIAVIIANMIAQSIALSIVLLPEFSAVISEAKAAS